MGICTLGGESTCCTPGFCRFWFVGLWYRAFGAVCVLDMADNDGFVEAPAEELLDRYNKDQLLKMSEYYGI